ncbi:RNA polymerase sigma factor [Luedemannella helvata]|uniref:RNA polymerase sigma factor n=1 Tax=Luedemannella helvata TaxID=349315 RepID=A0ABP4VQP5_9ACTN
MNLGAGDDLDAGEAVRAGAADALTDLYRGSYRRLVLQLFAFTTDLTEAQDVVQEAFARALARPKGLDDVENPEAWLRTVAINVVRRRYRRRRLLDTILLRDRPVQAMVAEAPQPDRADLRAALAQLPRPYREVVVLHYLADLPVESVAQLLDIPVGTVKSRLSRARGALATQLDGYRAETADAPARVPAPRAAAPAAARAAVSRPVVPRPAAPLPRQVSAMAATATEAFRA